uniref:Uncharacterized protein n=1 Tax=Arundo donax TaxID=35708 RepID=A0A0A9BP34_ARUDO
MELCADKLLLIRMILQRIVSMNACIGPILSYGTSFSPLIMWLSVANVLPI